MNQEFSIETKKLINAISETLPADMVHIHGNSAVFCIDCNIGMKFFNDKFFDLAPIDTPYGIGEDGSRNKSRSKKTNFGKKNTRKTIVEAKNYKPYSGNDLKAPDKNFFNYLFKVSKNQIIWGANHFISNISINSSCWLVWDKLNGESDFADCELAWTSFNSAVRKFSFRWSGMLQGNMNRKQYRIHPNEKPFELYYWTYKNYLPNGGKVLDTHLGSQSNRVAAYKRGNIEFIAFESDFHYFKDGNSRFMKEISIPLFDNNLQNIQQDLFK